jgi:hypothetical protein
MLGFEKKKKFHTPSSHQAPSQYVKLAAHIPINVLPPGVTCGVIITHFGSTFQVEKLRRQYFQCKTKTRGKAHLKDRLPACLVRILEKFQSTNVPLAEWQRLLYMLSGPGQRLVVSESMLFVNTLRVCAFTA